MHTRTTLTDILYIHFRNPALATLCRETSREKILENNVSRAFDQFPNILSDEAFLRELNEFESIYMYYPKQILK